MRFAICNETFQGWNWDDTCRFVAETGYDGIEIAPFTLAEDVRQIPHDERHRIRRIATDSDLEIVGLHWLLVSPAGLSVTFPDSSIRSETSDYLISLVEFCADVGGRVMVFGSPKQRWAGEGDDRGIAVNRMLDSIRPALDCAAQAGITICLEPLPAPEANLLLTLAEAQELIERLAHPAAQTILDIKSALSENREIPALIRQFAPLIAHVHVNDSNRRGPGFGDTDFRPILATLNEIDYSGFVSVEVFDYSPDPQTIAVECLRYLKSCL